MDIQSRISVELPSSVVRRVLPEAAPASTAAPPAAAVTQEKPVPEEIQASEEELKVMIKGLRIQVRVLRSLLVPGQSVVARRCHRRIRRIRECQARSCTASHINVAEFVGSEGAQLGFHMFTFDFDFDFEG